MQFTNNEIICRSVKDGEKPIRISLSKIVEAERRQNEVACLTPDKAPELLYTFNHAWTLLHKAKTVLQYQLNLAQNEAAKRKSVVLLEIVPAKLKELNIGSSADVREAILSQDAIYQDRLEAVLELEAAIEYLAGKLKSFDNAFTSVKRLLQGPKFDHTERPHLDGTGGEIVGQVSAYGKPKY